MNVGFQRGESSDEQPGLLELLTIHRSADGFVAFANKDEDGRFQNLASIRVEDLRTMLPGLAPWLIRDAYFTVNGMYRQAPFPSKATGLPGVWRKESDLRWLNACYVDLDVGRRFGSAAHRMTWRDAAAAVGNLMDDKVIPQCSMFVRSGQGLYVIWLLCDRDDPTQPVRAWPENVAFYKRIQKSMVDRLQDLAADASAVDAARVLRVPNTLHSATQEPAKYFIQLDADGCPYTYTLDELGTFLGIRNVKSSLPQATRKTALGSRAESDAGTEAPPSRGAAAPADPNRNETAEFGRPIIERGTAPHRAKGARVRAGRRANDLVTLEQYHGGWPKGKRRKQLRLYAALLRAAGTDAAQVLEAVQEMAANCRPAYPSDPNDEPLNQLVEGVFKSAIANYSNDRLCQWQGVTPELARELNLLSIVPDEVREERKPPLGGAREQKKQARRQVLRDHVARFGVALSSRDAVKVLAEAGYSVAISTANEDLREVLANATRASAGRKPKGATAAQRSLMDELG